MELRDYFAGKALPEVIKMLNEAGKSQKKPFEVIDIANTAYEIADAMMEAKGV